MKVRYILMAAAAWLLLAGKPALAIEAAQGVQQEKTPSFFIPESEFDFGTVIEGTQVQHAFAVENHGGGTLYIKEVRPTCGCTTSDFSKEIPPHGKGAITVTFDSTGYQSSVAKSILVVTSDPMNQETTLKITGTAEPFALISPPRVFLQGSVNEEIKASVSIVKLDKYPFKIVETVVGERSGYISMALTEKEKGYDLTVSNSCKKKGRYFETITLKTGSPLKPEIKIKVMGLIKD